MSDFRIHLRKNWRSIPLERETARSLGDEFHVTFLQSVSRLDPENIEVLVQLGDLYSRLGRVEESLRVDLKLVDLCPEEKVFHYNLACSYSLMGRMDLSLLAIEKALLLGYDDLDQIQTDADLENVRKDVRFRRLVQAHFKLAR